MYPPGSQVGPNMPPNPKTPEAGRVRPQGSPMQGKPLHLPPSPPSSGQSWNFNPIGSAQAQEARPPTPPPGSQFGNYGRLQGAVARDQARGGGLNIPQGADIPRQGTGYRALPEFNRQEGRSSYGGGSSTLSGTGRGWNVPRSEVTDYIRQSAQRYGVDPETAVRVAQSEGLNNYIGDSGSSFGPFQLHYGGVAGGGNKVGGLGDEFTRQTGLNARDPSTWKQQVDFSMQRASKGGWGPFHGAAKTGISKWAGIGGMPGSSSAMASGGGTTSKSWGEAVDSGDFLGMLAHADAGEGASTGGGSKSSSSPPTPPKPPASSGKSSNQQGQGSQQRDKQRDWSKRHPLQTARLPLPENSFSFKGLPKTGQRRHIQLSGMA
jgi:hypothetical protein